MLGLDAIATMTPAGSPLTGTAATGYVFALDGGTCHLIGGSNYLSGFDPYVDLSSKMVLAIDYRRADLVVASGGKASSVRNVIGVKTLVQATGASQPGWDATTGFSFDGVDDTLTNMSWDVMPSGANPWHYFALVDSQGTGLKYAFGWGWSGLPANAVDFWANEVSGTRRYGVNIGGLSALTAASGLAGGLHVVEVSYDGTVARISVDGGPFSTVSGTANILYGVPATNARARMSGRNQGTVTGPWQGKQYIHFGFSSKLLDVERSMVLEYLNNVKSVISPSFYDAMIKTNVMPLASGTYTISSDATIARNRSYDLEGGVYTLFGGEARVFTSSFFYGDPEVFRVTPEVTLMRPLPEPRDMVSPLEPELLADAIQDDTIEPRLRRT